MEIRKCVQCGKEFEISDGEKVFFEKNGLNLPKRCPECRQKNKKEVSKSTENSVSYNIKKGNSKDIRITLKGVLIFICAFVVLFFILNSVFNNQTQSESKITGSAVTKYKNSNSYSFRSSSLLNEHYSKHGAETNSKSVDDYLKKANAVISNSSAIHKTESEDGDDIYFVPATNEIVFLSSDGYIRTYFIADYDYYNKQ